MSPPPVPSKIGMEFFLSDDYDMLDACSMTSWDAVSRFFAEDELAFSSSSAEFMIPGPMMQDLNLSVSAGGTDLEQILKDVSTVNCEIQVAPYSGRHLQPIAETDSYTSRSPQRLNFSGFTRGSDIPGVDSQIYHAWGEDGASILQHLEASGRELHQRIVSFSFKRWSLRRAPHTCSSTRPSNPSDGGISTVEVDTTKEILITDPKLSEVPMPESYDCPSARSIYDFDQHFKEAELGGPLQVEAQVLESPSRCSNKDGTHLEECSKISSPLADPSIRYSEVDGHDSCVQMEAFPIPGCLQTQGLRQNSISSLEQAIEAFVGDVGRFQAAVQTFKAEICFRWSQDIRMPQQKETSRTRHQFSKAEMLCIAKAVKSVLSFWSADQGPSLAFWKAVYEATNFSQAISPNKLQSKWRYELCKYFKRQPSKRANPGDRRFKEWRCEHLSFCNHLLGRQ